MSLLPLGGIKHGRRDRVIPRSALLEEQEVQYGGLWCEPQGKMRRCTHFAQVGREQPLYLTLIAV